MYLDSHCPSLSKAGVVTKPVSLAMLHKLLLYLSNLSITYICASLAFPVNAKLGTALEALQLCLKLLPPSCRDELRRLLTFMALAGDPQGIKLDKEVRAGG